MGCHCSANKPNKRDDVYKEKPVPVVEKKNNPQSKKETLNYSSKIRRIIESIKENFVKNNSEILQLKRDDISKSLSFDQVIWFENDFKIWQGRKANSIKKYEIRSIAIQDGNWENAEYKSFINELKNKEHENYYEIQETYMDNKYGYAVSDKRIGMTLLEVFEKRKYLTQDETSEIIKKLLEVTHFLHNAKIFNLDIKPENILFPAKTLKSEPKLFSFNPIPFKKRQAKIGETSIYFLSPETVNLEDEINEKQDIFAIGVLMYWLLCGEPPFNEITKEDFYSTIISQNVTYHQHVWGEISAEAKHLINKMTDKNSQRRPSAKECLAHGYFTKEVIMLRNMNSIEKVGPLIPFDLNNYIFLAFFYQEIVPKIVESIKSEEYAKFQEFIHNKKTTTSEHKLEVIKLKDLADNLQNFIDDYAVEKEFELFLKRFDPNQTINISLLLKEVERLKSEIRDELNWDLFKFLDINSEGQVCIQDITKSIIMGGLLDEKDLENTLRSVSPISSTKINYEEFKKLMNVIEQ